MFVTDIVTPPPNCRVQMQLEKVWNDIERWEHRVEKNNVLLFEQSSLVEVLQYRLVYVEKQYQVIHKQGFVNLIER